MKISEERLIEELQDMALRAESNLKKLYGLKMHQNTFGVGYHSGILEVSQDILKLILEGGDED